MLIKSERVKESRLFIKDQINIFAKVTYFNYYLCYVFTLAMIFILSPFSYTFFVSPFCLFLNFFESQILLNVSWIAKCDKLIRTLEGNTGI